MSAQQKCIRRAQRATMDIVTDLIGLGQRMHEIAEDIPLRFGTDNMLENDVPIDVGFELHGTLQTIRTHELSELIELVKVAATVSQEDLDRDFIRRKNESDAALYARSTS
jgi:hypothetical protein